MFRRAITLLLLVALGACFESDEERAVRAYTERDHETAQELARELAAADNPRGFDLLALMAAQGMGQPVYFEQALANAATQTETRHPLDHGGPQAPPTRAGRDNAYLAQLPTQLAKPQMR
ncbi:MAG: hypothetical protein QGF53_11765 [Alphaproteobacteria bacterium]|nr:hypothetical protein [Alphaproteobacteria bacterium]